MAEPWTTRESKPTDASKIPEGDYVLVPEGYFLMGCEMGRDEERPVHRVWVDAFEMAVFQVRNREWTLFLEATGHPEPPNWNHPDFKHPDQPRSRKDFKTQQTTCK
ncbi:MAG TPA: SUMF1/EgtB/PvdO family nonheme iron enzyme [Acidobacteriota bacterium]|jgi:formylglycine-generating enzyme required for sulfatase activity|nr:SUMF1/EgtB/PvdO family nonheme iron enzyme [Acidobacteriota bacterium]